MYEQYKAEFLLERMLSRVDDKIDKREGSVIYDALAPASVEADIYYIKSLILCLEILLL